MGSSEQRGEAVPAAPALPGRQEDVLALAAEGLSTEASAAVLGVSTDTVKTHRQHLLKRLAAPTMTAAVHRYQAWWGLDPFLRAQARLSRPERLSGTEPAGLDGQQRRVEQWLRRLGITLDSDQRQQLRAVLAGTDQQPTGPGPGESVADSILRR